MERDLLINEFVDPLVNRAFNDKTADLVHPDDQMLHIVQLMRGSVCCRQRAYFRLNDAPELGKIGLQDVFVHKLKAERILAQTRYRSHKGTLAALYLQDTAGNKKLHRFPYRSAADIERVCQLLLVRQLRADGIFADDDPLLYSVGYIFRKSLALQIITFSSTYIT